MAHVGHSDSLCESVSKNYFKILENKNYNKLYLDSFPMLSHIGLTTVCNMSPRCDFCLYLEEDREMSRVVLDELGKDLFNTTFCVNFSIDGEPIVYREFLSVVMAIKGYIKLQTNGLSLKLRDPSVLDNLRAVCVSLDAATRNTYSFFRPDKFYNVIDNVKFMVEYRKQRRCLHDIRLDFIIMECNKHEIFDFIALSKELGVDRVYLSYLYKVGGVIGNLDRNNTSFIYEEQQIDKEEIKRLYDSGIEYARSISIDIEVDSIYV